jgi:hypothetical protein
MILTAEFWEEYERNYTNPEFFLKIKSEKALIKVLKRPKAFHLVAYCKYRGNDFNQYFNKIISLIKEKLQQENITTNNGGINWSVRATDTPNNLSQLLETQGLRKVGSTHKMGIALKNYNFKGAIENKNLFVNIRKVSPADLFEEKLLELTLKCFPQLFKDISSVKALKENRIEIAEKTGDQFLNYGVYTKKNNIPVGFASMVIKKDLPNIGYLSGAGTDIEYRKKGIYTSLLTGRIQEAKRIGLEYLITDAEEKTSAPILEKHGFSFIEKYEIYRYTF